MDRIAAAAASFGPAILQRLVAAGAVTQAQVDAAADIGSSRVKLFEMSVDLSTSFDQVDKAVKETISKMGPVFMLVNCAGWTKRG